MLRYFKYRAKQSKTFQSYSEDIVVKFSIFYSDFSLIHKIIVDVELRNGEKIKEDRDLYHKFKIGKNRKLIVFKLNKIRTKFRYHHEWYNFRNDVISNIFRPIPKYWDEVLPDKVAIWASKELKRLSDKEDCCDNFRVAKVGNSPQERRYRRQAKSGCCGFSDQILICPINGDAYRLGFNYGH